MDELTSKITQMLNDPEGLDMVKSLAASLMNGKNDADEQKKSDDTASESKKQPKAAAIGGLSDILPDIPFSPAQLSTIMKVLGQLKNEQDDEQAHLLMALKPHLSEERQKKADNAAKMLKIVRLLPLIKDTGLFDLF